MKTKWLFYAFVAMMSLFLIVGCGTDTDEASGSDKASGEAGEYEDGLYFAQEDGFSEDSGWKYVVTLEVEDGEIVKADWNGANINGGDDKKTSSTNGDYGMVEKGGAQAEWHEQAEKAEAHLLEIQDPTAIEYTSDEGHTDAISGVSIHVVEFFDLAEKALANGPVDKGAYKDGAYFEEQDSFDEKSGWKYTASLTVINGTIVAADWDGVHKDGGDDKDTVSANGEYGMVENGGAQDEWHVQAEKAEAYLLEKQDPTAIEYTTDEGHTDAISGVSIHVVEFFDLAEKALADAK
ncbi:FMN-binding protein [Aquibacillus koreensis]|uniref:FMN-binding protein n=1 Tax=Aquibacillus koreensis TaxID=279446 RepID=A0A9X4AGU4_9BACI|nr:FMN-binding protein [Aquibacillus koreensis]MCT2536475.1 FMN-binding protein [Aquibacillus koreensis]MDC3419437.1 FMN-binding protein [Aquibacillus koreensis]